MTADQGNTERPCIAIRNDSTLGDWFWVSVGVQEWVRGRLAWVWHRAKLLHCDWGPAEETGRSIDVTGEGDEALGFSQSSFPTEAPAEAQEIAEP